MNNPPTPNEKAAALAEAATSAELSPEASRNATVATSPQPDYFSSLDFLQRFAPAGPWVLTAIDPEKKGIETRTFRPGHEDALRKWCAAQGRVRNLYFHVNEPRYDLTKKAERTDIKAVHHLHVDIDPRAQEDVGAEQSRIRTLLTERLPNGVPAPTVVVFSGGGVGAYWRLREPIPINGDEALAEDTKLYNKQLEILLGGDNCANVDRLMRLPGSVNWPDARKRAKGRRPALAAVVGEWHEDRVYDISQFSKAPAQKPATASSKHPAAEIAPDAVRRIDLDELPPSVKPECKVIIVQGHDPDNPKPLWSRSEWLIKVVTHLVRAGCTDQVIYNIITDPGYNISASVRDKGSRSEAYARRQIEQARRKVAEDDGDKTDDKLGPRDLARQMLADRGEPLIHLNDQYHTWRGGAYRAREDNTLRREAYDHMEAARLKPNQRSVTSVLDALRSLVHLDRDDYSPPCWSDGLATRPDPRELLVCRNGLLHLPTGQLTPHDPAFLTHNALDYAYEPGAPEPEQWHKFLKQVWPSEEEADCIAALQEWFGYLLTPDTSQQKILVLVGPKRSGKGTIARVLTALLGQHNVCAPRLSQFGEQFGLQPLIGKQVAMVSDMRLGSRADKAAIAEALLTISGEDYVSVPRKNVADWEGRLRTRFVVMSNEPPTISDPSGALPGRYIVLTMRQSFYGREDTGLTDRLLTERPGILNWAVKGWHALKATGRLARPMSSADMVRQIERGSSMVNAFVEDCCELGIGATVWKDDLYRAYALWAQQEGMAHRATKEQFGKELLSAFGDRVQGTRPNGPDGKRHWAYDGLRLLAPDLVTAPRDDSDDLPF